MDALSPLSTRVLEDALESTFRQRERPEGHCPFPTCSLREPGRTPKEGPSSPSQVRNVGASGVYGVTVVDPTLGFESGDTETLCRANTNKISTPSKRRVKRNRVRHHSDTGDSPSFSPTPTKTLGDTDCKGTTVHREYRGSSTRPFSVPSQV